MPKTRKSSEKTANQSNKVKAKEATPKKKSSKKTEENPTAYERLVDKLNKKRKNE